MSLKEITKELHTEAEKSAFAKLLLSGNITKEKYVQYLTEMQPIYQLIEKHASAQGILDTLPGIKRANAILEDIRELSDVVPSSVLKPTVDYLIYLDKLCEDVATKHLIKAHLYVRHMGDLFGGQFIAKKVPGSGKFYQFDNPDELKVAIRELLTDDLGDEAKVAFQWAIKIMDALGE
jgi:heme oxygenase